MAAERPTSAVQISYFTDVLCVWAYVAQARLDELAREFGARIRVEYHFIPVFGVVDERVGDRWKDRGGYRGYGAHVTEVSRRFPHVEVASNVWQGPRPQSSANAHLFLKAVQRLVERGVVTAHPDTARNGRTPFEDAAWRLRVAFFKDTLDVTRRDVQLDIADELGLPREPLLEEIEGGGAMAALCRDADLCRQLAVEGSPTFVLNEGRQKLYGNVGYRIIAANVSEILRQPEAETSWC